MKHVFNAKQCILPQLTLDNVIKLIMDFIGINLSAPCFSYM